jgi:MFS superfamily sulfate permease-like transporter
MYVSIGLVERLMKLTVACLPKLSVVGGYLAYIGWFCGVSGVGLMAGSSDVTLGVVVDSWAFVLPGILGGIWIYIYVRRLRHMAVLPTCILFLLLVFYGILWTTGTTVEEARGDGWIRESEPAPVWYHSWDYLRLDKVAWAALPDLILTELSMIFVVALSSSLDVAAIELELNSPLDYNHELKTVGISNIISGLTGT